MVNFDDPNQIEIVNFTLPFSGRLNPDIKWIRFTKMIPCSNGIPYIKKVHFKI